MKSKSPLSLVDLCSYDVVDFLHNFPTRFPPYFVQISFHSLIFLWIVLFLVPCIISYHLILCHIIYHIISIISYQSYNIISSQLIKLRCYQIIPYHIIYTIYRVVSYHIHHIMPFIVPCHIISSLIIYHIS